MVLKRIDNYIIPPRKDYLYLFIAIMLSAINIQYSISNVHNEISLKFSLDFY